MARQQKPVQFFERAEGLNTKDDPARLKITEKGSAELAVAVNVAIGQNGRISRRKGFIRKVSGSGFHSLFPVGDYALCAQGTNLLVLEHDFTATAIGTVTPRRRISYARVADTVFWSNGVENGLVFQRQVLPWQAGEYVGPDTTRTFSDPPAGHLICQFNGRIYIAQTIFDGSGMAHHVIWYTEPFAYDRVDLARNFIPVEYRVVTLGGLPGSLIVGTTGGVYAFIGANPDEFVVRKLSDSPVVAGTAAHTRSEKIGEAEAGGQVILLTTNEGVCLVGDSGYFYNMTRRKIEMPRFGNGCAAIVNDRYLTCLYS